MNELVQAALAGHPQAHFLDANSGFVHLDGTISHHGMYEYLHLNHLGYTAVHWTGTPCFCICWPKTRARVSPCQRLTPKHPPSPTLNSHLRRRRKRKRRQRRERAIDCRATGIARSSLESQFHIGPLTSVDTAGQQKGYCVLWDKACNQKVPLETAAVQLHSQYHNPMCQC